MTDRIEPHDTLNDVRDFLRSLPNGGPDDLSRKVTAALYAERSKPAFDFNDPVWVRYIEAKLYFEEEVEKFGRSHHGCPSSGYAASDASLNAAVMRLIERGPWRCISTAPKAQPGERAGVRILGWGRYNIALDEGPYLAVTMRWREGDYPGWYAEASTFGQFEPTAWQPIPEGPR